jgi:hypothetical protein
MIREHLFHKRAPADRMFRWRGGDVSRIEGLSDGVFAITLTLLVVTLQPPATLYELWLTIRDLPVFLVCFALLMMAWRYHYLFFRRYGLEDFLTSLLNAAFLFLILFFAFPLRFLAQFLWHLVLGEPAAAMFVLPAGIEWEVSALGQRMGMMVFYGLGIVGVFGVLALMNVRAHVLRDELELDELERYLTVAAVRSHLLTAGIGVLSLVVLAATGMPGWSGVTYFLMGPLHGVLGWWQMSRASRIHDSVTQPRK